MRLKLLYVLLLFFINPCFALSDTDYQFFQKVHNVPYYTNGSDAQLPSEFWMNNYGDCDDKSMAFADYLYFQGYKPIICTRQGRIGTHSYLILDGLVYDPTFGYYAMNTSIYDTLWTIACPGYIDLRTPYKPKYEYAVLCELMSKQQQ